jgi:hypothetical protein
VRGLAIVFEVFLAACGLVIFVYGDLSTHRGLRIAGVVLVTLAIVAAAVISALRERDP